MAAKELKNKDLYIIRETLNGMTNFRSLEFASWLCRNLKIVNSEIEILEAGLKSEKFNEYQKKKHEIHSKYCKKDALGELQLTIQGRYQIEDEESHNKEIEKLKSEYKDVLIDREKVVAEMEKLQEKKVNSSVKCIQISKKELPKEISGNEFIVLDMYNLIKY